MDIEGIVVKVREALQRFADKPAHHCADCGAEQPILPTRIEAKVPEATRPEWEITAWTFNWAYAWITVAPTTPGDVPVRIYCPECRKKKGL